MQNVSVDDAVDWCRGNRRCAGFTAFTSNDPCSKNMSVLIEAHFQDAWGTKHIDRDSTYSSWVVPGPRPPAPYPVPPNPCHDNVTDEPQFHIMNMGVGPHDVNAIFFYKGIWHVMHQANWTDWAHLVSHDLVHWSRLPSTLSPNGDWDGALTLLEGDRPVILYDCYNVADCRPSSSRLSTTVGDPAIVGVAWPDDEADQNLTKWYKDAQNPIVIHGARGGYAGPSTIWKANDLYTMAMPLNGAIALFQTASSSFHEWNVTNAVFYPTSSGPSRFVPLLGSVGAPSESYTHVLFGIQPPKPHRIGTPWYALGMYDGNHTLSKTGAPAALDASELLVFAELHRVTTKDATRSLFIGWFNVGKGCLTFPREAVYDSHMQTIASLPVQEIAALYGTTLGSHGAVQLAEASALSIFTNGQGSQTFDLEAVIRLQPGRVVAFVMAIMASSPEGAEVLLTVNVSAPFTDAVIASGSLRRVNASALVPMAVDSAFNSTFSFVMSDAPSMAVRVLADRTIVEIFLASGHGVVTTPVLKPGLDPSKDGAFILAGKGGLDVDSVIAQSVGCGWAHYP